jgi:hypothetical protein
VDVISTSWLVDKLTSGQGRRGQEAVQRCKSERSSCAKVQKWRDGVAGDKLARGHVGKELTSGGPEAQRLRGPEHGQLKGEPETGGLAGVPIFRSQVSAVGSLVQVFWSGYRFRI